MGTNEKRGPFGRRAVTIARAGCVLVRSVGRGFLVAVEVVGLLFWLRCNRPLAWAVEVAPSA